MHTRDATCPGTSAQSQVWSQALCSSLGTSSFPGCVCLPLPPFLTPVRHRPSPGGRGGNQHPFNGLCRAHVYLCCCIERPALTLRYCYICSTERELETEGNSARPSGSRSQPLRTGRDAPTDGPKPSSAVPFTASLFPPARGLTGPRMVPGRRQAPHLIREHRMNQLSYRKSPS